MNDRARKIDALRRNRPRRLFVRWSLAVMGAVAAASWLAGGFETTGRSWVQQRENAARFLTDLIPWSVRDTGNWSEAGPWLASLWNQTGREAVLATLAISVAAIVLAGLAGGLMSLAAARNFSTPGPFLPGGAPPTLRRRSWFRLLVAVSRLILIFMRAIPEYVWAFLFLALYGPSAWPLILALAVHNTGILGKLNAEIIENNGSKAPSALRAQGAGRFQILFGSLLPLSLPRFLLYFFYRWETCVREATVLGMLGSASLGFWIVESRARNRYDEMFFYVLCGVLLVLLADLISGFTRRLLRRA